MVLLLVLLSASPLDEAHTLIAEARFEEVAAVLAPLVADQRAPASERAAAEVLVGLAAHHLLDEQGASRAFSRARSLDPQARLPAGASPRAAALFNASKPVQPLAPKAEVVRFEPAPPGLRPTRVAALVGGGLALALGVSGGILTGVGLDGRAAAVAEPVGLLSAQRFDAASASYAWGTGLLFAAAVTLLTSTVLFFLPGAP